MTFAGHTGPLGYVTACAVAPDSSYVVSASSDTTLRIWDLVTGRERVTLAGHAGAVTACAIAPDGSYVVSASRDATLRIWDPETGRTRLTLAGHASAVTACAIAPDSSYVLSASEDHSLRVWDARSGAGKAVLTGHTDAVTACAIAPDGALMVSGGADSTLRLWDQATGAELAVLPLLADARCVAMHPSRAVIMCGDGGTNVYLVEPVGVEYGTLVEVALGPIRTPGSDAARASTPAQVMVGAAPLGGQASEAAMRAQAAMNEQDWQAAVLQYSTGDRACPRQRFQPPCFG